jgi:hypothetical protein
MPDSDHPAQEPQSARAVLMVRPACFGFNPQTAASNAFQRPASGSVEAEAHELVLSEFDALATALQRAGVEVLIAPDTLQPVKPDAIFPNNWVSFHFDGTVVIYPMLAPNRRLERREDILEQVVRKGRFHVSRTVDLTHREAEGKFLEGTGSLVLDRAHRVAYAGLSPRTDLDVLGEFAQVLDYDLVTFEAQGATAQPVYHTNVVMSIGTRFAVVCGEAIAQTRHRDAVFNSLHAAGHAIVDITLQQMLEFAANLLELAAAKGPCIALSTTAWRALALAQRRVLESHAEVIPANIPTIERIGGGGVRCMLAEVHLPKRADAPQVGRASHLMS